MLFLSFGLFICYVAALLICSGNLVSLYNHISSTTRAFFCNWSAPAHKITLRVVNTAIVFSSLPCFLKHNILTAFRAIDADFFKIRHSESAVRKSRTCQKLAVRSVFYNQIASALRADFICHLIMYCNLLKLIFSLVDCLFKIRLKILNNCLPVNLPLFYRI